MREDEREAIGVSGPDDFGVISENTRMAKVTISVPAARAHFSSPNSSMAMTLTKVAAAAFTRLLPSRMTPSILSVWLRRARAFSAA